MLSVNNPKIFLIHGFIHSIFFEAEMPSAASSSMQGTQAPRPLIGSKEYWQLQKTTIMTKDDIAVTRRGNGQDVVLRSADLIELCHPKQWMNTDQVDFVFDMMHNKFPSFFTITFSNFVCKFYDPAIKASVWRNTRKDDKESVVDECYNYDITSANHILHPLQIHNHWVLLFIEKSKKSCIIYNSKKHTETLRKDTQKNALPVFLTASESKSKVWTCKYYVKSAQQHDGR